VKADTVYKHVDSPSDMWCDSGHHAHETFKREGPKGKPLPTRFWRVSGKGFDKVVCEPCLVLINYMIKRKKERHGI
jgi:hypothetical protein